MYRKPTTMLSDMWIFGYGSLIWKAGFPYEEKIVGYVKGYERKFYQLSTDHRGTPEYPGRVVTLIPNEQETVWGVAYRIAESNVEYVLSHLDYREKGGYVRLKVLFYPNADPSAPFEITIYIGSDDNENYGGEADDFAIAEQVVRSVGPSGPNLEYLCNLAKAMREIAPHVNDQHLFNIERIALQLLNKSCL